MDLAYRHAEAIGSGQRRDDEGMHFSLLMGKVGRIPTGDKPHIEAWIHRLESDPASNVVPDGDGDNSQACESIPPHVPKPKRGRPQDADPKGDGDNLDDNTALSPSRTKAKAAYDWAMSVIPGAERMTIAQLFDAISSHPSKASEMLPPNSEAFGKYLRDAGMKRYDKTGNRRPSRSVHRSNQT